MKENVLEYMKRPISEGRNHSTWISGDNKFSNCLYGGVPNGYVQLYCLQDPI